MRRERVNPLVSPRARRVPPHAADSVPARISAFPQTMLRSLFQKRTRLTRARKVRIVTPTAPPIKANSRGPNPASNMSRACGMPPSGRGRWKGTVRVRVVAKAVNAPRATVIT